MNDQILTTDQLRRVALAHEARHLLGNVRAEQIVHLASWLEGVTFESPGPYEGVDDRRERESVEPPEDEIRYTVECEDDLIPAQGHPIGGPMEPPTEPLFDSEDQYGRGTQ